MNEFVERSPGGKLFHSCEHPPFSILRCITTLRLLAGVRDGEHIDLYIYLYSKHACIQDYNSNDKKINNYLLLSV